MRKFSLSIFLLIITELFVFSQSYDDWEKVFSENKKENLEETFAAVGITLEKSNTYEKMFFLFMLYYMKCEISYQENNENKNDIAYKIRYNAEYSEAVRNNPTFENESKIFIDFLKKNDYILFGITALEKYDVSKYYKPVSIRELLLLVSKYEGKRVSIQAEYEYTEYDTAYFRYFDSADEMWKIFSMLYTENAAEQLLHIKKEKYQNQYTLYGTVKNARFVIEYIEHR